MVNILYATRPDGASRPGEEWAVAYDLDYERACQWRVDSHGVEKNEKDGSLAHAGIFKHLDSGAWIQLTETQAFKRWPALKLVITEERNKDDKPSTFMEAW